MKHIWAKCSKDANRWHFTNREQDCTECLIYLFLIFFPLLLFSIHVYLLSWVVWHWNSDVMTDSGVFYIRVKCQSVSWLVVTGNQFPPALLQAYREKEQPRLFLYMPFPFCTWGETSSLLFYVVFDCGNSHFWQLLGVDLNTYIISNLQWSSAV